MKFNKAIFSLATFALGFASAATSYEVTFSKAVKIGATEVKAGDYKVEVQGDKAIFKNGKNTVEVPATLATGDKKYSVTSMAISDSKVKEIELGGTKSKIVFSGEAPAIKGN